MELLIECEQYLIEGERERIFKLYKSYREHFLEDCFWEIARPGLEIGPL